MTSKHLTAVSLYTPKTQVTGWPYGLLRQPVKYARLWNFVIFCARVVIVPPPLDSQKKYNRCYSSLYVPHWLGCINRVLVILCHNKFCDKFLYLTQKSSPFSTMDATDKRIRQVREGSDWRKEVKFSSEAYGKCRLTLSSTSDLEILTRIPTSMSQWISSWLVGIWKTRIIMVSTAMSNRIFFSVYPLIGWHDLEWVSSCNLKFESIHGRKTQGTHFTHIWMGQQPDRNRSH